MDMDNSWSEEQKKDFVFHYENIHFKENNPDIFTKCYFKRQSIHQLIQGAQHLTSNEATCQLLRNKLREYSAIVDKQDGVNNYANGVLDLISHNSNDAKSWSSQANASDLLKQFLKPLPGNCYNKTSEGCSAQKPSKTELETFLNKKNVPNSLSVLKRPTSSLSAKSVPYKSSVTNGQVDFSVNNPASVNNGKSLNVPNKRRAESSSKTAPPGSRVINAIESKVFGTGRTVGAVKNQIQQKPVQAPSFRTAGTELKLQNAKKYGQQGAANSSGGDSLSYGNNKKSLGGRTRSVNSKFVPPVKPDSQESVNSEPSSCGDDVEDERLRLIDPKMVELVRSEIMDHGPPVGWDDIAGLHFAKATIQEIVVLPMLRPDIFTGLRRPPKGILLFGPPGTGKTLIGKCIASQSNSTFFNISASSLTSKWVGEGEKMVRTLFTLASVYQPAVVFIDEIDSLLSQRSDTEHESSRRIKTEFLVQLDGAGTGEDDRVLVIGATNRPQELDEAARRRLVKRLYIPLPDHQARCQIVQRLMSTERSELTEEQIQQIAALTDGYSGADMKVVCQEASLGPIRSISFTDMQHIAPDQVRPVTVDDFTSALSRVRTSVSPRDLEAYVTWDQTYGSGGAPK